MNSASSANKRTFTQSISSTPQPDLADPNKRTKLPETPPLFTDASDREKATESLLQAFNAENEQGVKDALKAGADIDVKTASGKTLLMEAIKRGWRDMAEFLLEKSSSVTINVSNQGQTALSLACGVLNWYPKKDKEDTDFLTKLFEQCTDETINQIDKEGRTALMNAFGFVDDVAFLTKLFDRCIDETINQIDKEGSTLLMEACRYVKDDVFLSKIFERCSDKTINQIHKKGYTALMMACDYEGIYDLETHEPKYATDSVFLTKLFERCRPETINQISKFGSTAVMEACRYVREPGFLTKLLDNCTDKTINQIDESGTTALMEAAFQQSDAPFLIRLLDRCTDETINRIEEEHLKTALLNACGGGTDLVFLTKLFERCRPETINFIHYTGQTAVIEACRYQKDVGFLETLLGQTSDSALNAVCDVNDDAESVLTALVNDAANVDLAKHLIPLFLDRLTWDNLRIKVFVPASPDKLTAWQIVNQRGVPWADTAKRIGEAMVMVCAQYAIPRSPFVEGFARSTRNLAKYSEEETRANRCDQVLGSKDSLPEPIPQDILDIIRSYHENPFRDLSQAVSAINDFMTWHLAVQKKKCPADGSHALQGVPEVLAALHDSKSTLNQCLAEYKASRRKAARRDSWEY